MFRRRDSLKTVFGLHTLAKDTQLLVEKLEQRVRGLEEIENRTDAARRDMHLLFSEIQTALQALGFVNVRLRQLPMGEQQEKKEPKVFDNQTRQRLEGGLPPESAQRVYDTSKPTGLESESNIDRTIRWK